MSVPVLSHKETCLLGSIIVRSRIGEYGEHCQRSLLLRPRSSWQEPAKKTDSGSATGQAGMLTSEPEDWVSPASILWDNHHQCEEALIRANISPFCLNLLWPSDHRFHGLMLSLGNRVSAGNRWNSRSQNKHVEWNIDGVISAYPVLNLRLI